MQVLLKRDAIDQGPRGRVPVLRQDVGHVDQQSQIEAASVLRRRGHRKRRSLSLLVPPKGGADVLVEEAVVAEDLDEVPEEVRGPIVAGPSGRPIVGTPRHGRSTE